MKYLKNVLIVKNKTHLRFSTTALVIASIVVGFLDNVIVLADDDFVPPSIAAVASLPNELKDQAKSAFLFDPVLDVNPNRGSFNTSIPISLPPNLIGLKDIRLVYQSHNPRNQGYGVGWSLDLPRIQPHFASHAYTPYLATGINGSHELVQTDESSDSLRAEIEKIFPEFRSKELIIYRPLVEGSFINFVKISQGNSDFGWVAMTLSGQRYVFSAAGALIEIQDLNQNTLALEWDQGVLKRIYEKLKNRPSWEMIFHYTGNKQKFVQPTSQGFQYLPLGLEKIQVRKSLGDYGFFNTYDEKIIDFVNEGGFLIRAGIRGGLLPLFQGSYSTINHRVDKKANKFTRHDDLHPIRESLSSPLTSVYLSPEPDLLELYVDLNNDGLTDRIRFNVKDEKLALDQINKICKEEGGSNDERKVHNHRERLGKPLATQVQYRVIDHQTGQTHWIDDPELMLPANLRPYEVRVQTRMEPGAFGNNDLQCYTQVMPRALFFVDLNRDGKKDLIDCKEDLDTTYPNQKVNVEPIKPDNLYLLEDDLEHKFRTSENEVKLEPIIIEEPLRRSHSNLALSVMNLTQPHRVKALPNYYQPHDPGNGDAPKNPYVDVFMFSGIEPNVYLQTINQTTVDQWISKNGKKLSTEMSFIPGLNLWSEPKKPNFKCNKSSLFFDANQDGFIDVLTGKTLYVGSENPDVFYPETVNEHIFFEQSSDISDLNDTQIIVVDSDGDGLFEVQQARALEIDPMSGKFELIRNGTTEVIVPRPASGKLLTSLKSPFEGEISIHYDFVGGLWAPLKIVKDPKGHQPLSETLYSYLDAIKDPFKGLFTGFSHISEITRSSDSRSAPRTTHLHYYKDLDAGAAFLYTRSRVHGMLKATQKLNEKDEILYQTQYQLDIRDMGNRRTLPYTQRRIEDVFNEGAKEIFDRKSTINYLYPKEDNLWAFDSKGTRVVPLQLSTEEIGMGIPSEHSDQLLDHKRITQKSYQYWPDRYVRRLVAKNIRDKDNKQYRADLEVSYDLESLLPTQSCYEKRCSHYSYDTLGRILGMKTTSGTFQEIEYEEESPLVTQIASNQGIEQRQYHPLSGQIQNQTLNTGAKFQYDYSLDGFLTEQTRTDLKDPLTYLKLNFKSRCDVRNSSCKADRSVLVSFLDSHEIIRLDGMGRFESSILGADTLSQRQTGTNLYGMGQEIIATSRARFLDSKSSLEQPYDERFNELRYEAHRDSLGRIIKEMSGTPGYEGYKTRTTRYRNNCDYSDVDGLRSSQCINLFGIMKSQSIGSEKIVFKTNADGDLLGLPSLGIEWDINAHQEIILSQADLDQAISKDQSGAASWNTGLREIEETEEGKLVFEPTQRVKLFTPFGKLKVSQKSTDFLTPIEATDLKDARDYDPNGNINKREVSLQNHSHQVFLDQAFSHDRIGTLSSIQSNGYELQTPRDDFGRATGFRILDPKTGQRIAELEYQYQDGKIVSIRQVAPAREIPLDNQLIKSITRDEIGRVIEFKLGNGSTHQREYIDQSVMIKKILWMSHLTEKSVLDNKSTLDPSQNLIWQESLTQNSSHQITGRESMSQLT